MGRPKKYEVKSINFGTKSHPARILIAIFIKLHGKQALSQLIRKLVIIYLSDKPEYEDWKIQKLLFRRQEINQEIGMLVKERCIVDDELEEKGYKIT